MNNDEECPSLLGTLEFLNFPDKMTEGFFEKISISHDSTQSSTQSSTSPTQESNLPTPSVTPNKIKADDLSSVSSEESKTSEESESSITSDSSEKSNTSEESKLTSESSSESSL